MHNVNKLSRKSMNRLNLKESLKNKNRKSSKRHAEQILRLLVGKI
jgi:hypothetical protein